MSTGALHRIHSRSEESPILGSTCTRTHHLADRFLYGEHGPVMGCWLSTRWLPPLRPTSTLGMYSRRRQACFVHGYLHSRATHLGGYGTPVLYRCSAYGSAGYRPPGIPVLVGSDTFGRVQSGIPTQRPGPETRIQAGTRNDCQLNERSGVEPTATSNSCFQEHQLSCRKQTPR